MLTKVQQNLINTFYSSVIENALNTAYNINFKWEQIYIRYFSTADRILAHICLPRESENENLEYFINLISKYNMQVEQIEKNGLYLRLTVKLADIEYGVVNG